MSENKIPEGNEQQPAAAPEAVQSGDVQDFMALVNEWGKPVLVAVIVAAVAALGISTWKNRQARQAEAESAALFQATAPEEFRQLAASGSEKSAPVALSFAAAGFYRQGNYDDARAAYAELAAMKDAGDLGVAAELGVAASLEAQGETEAACAAYDAWLEAHKGHFLETLAAGDAVRCHAAAGNFGRARVIAEDCKVAHPDDAVAQARFDEALQLVAQAERAASAASAAPEEPENPDVPETPAEPEAPAAEEAPAE